jgi:hypothetical protein
MNHPKPEEWVGYVYGETSGALRRELTQHLRACEQCREEVEGWQHSLKSLDSWKLPARTRPASFAMPVIRWAMAAAIVLLFGIMIGRASAPKVDMKKLSEAVAPKIQAELSAQLAQLARAEAERAGSLSFASARQYTDRIAEQLFVTLKKDVDTVAVNTAQRLYQLADYNEPQPQGAPNE